MTLASMIILSWQHVDKAVHEDKRRYQPLETFNLTINRCLKGNLEIGDKISGKAKREETRAVCPVHLDEKSEYLLLLTKSVSGFKLSRFSFPVKKGHYYFDDYLSQIENQMNQKSKKP